MQNKHMQRLIVLNNISMFEIDICPDIYNTHVYQLIALFLFCIFLVWINCYFIFKLLPFCKELCVGGLQIKQTKTERIQSVIQQKSQICAREVTMQMRDQGLLNISANYMWKIEVTAVTFFKTGCFCLQSNIFNMHF